MHRVDKAVSVALGAGERCFRRTTRYTALAPQRFKEFFRD
jgi:hypothetical protein